MLSTFTLIVCDISNCMILKINRRSALYSHHVLKSDEFCSAAANQKY